MWVKNGLIVNKISVPSITTYHQIMMRLTITIKETACDYLDEYIQGCMINEVDEIVIKFISDLKDITFSPFLAQPISMLYGKLLRNFIEEDFGDFDYIWLPNGSRHINT